MTFFNPNAVSNVIRDNSEGSYDAESLVIANSQRDDLNNEIRIWGEYKIEIMGINASGVYDHILDSPLLGAMITPVDCTMSGLLSGSSPNTGGDLCICNAGYEKGDNQDAKGASIQLMVCDPCPIGYFKVEGGNDVSCEACPPTTWTRFEASTKPWECICQQGMYDFRAYDANCISQNFFPTPTIENNNLCVECPSCLTCFGNNSIMINPNYWSDNEAPYVSYYCGNSEAGACTGGIEKTDDSLVRGPTTWTILQKDGPNHLRLW